MPELIIIHWRDIPSQVMAKAGRKSARVMLPDRFQQAIDRAAMRAGKGASDAYLDDWRRKRQPCSSNLQDEADAMATRLIEELDEPALEALVRVKGVAAHLGLSREQITALGRNGDPSSDTAGQPAASGRED